MKYEEIIKKLETDFGWTMTMAFDDMHKELIMDVAKIVSSQIEPLVMPKIAEIIENKKQKINEDLRDYLSKALDMTKKREAQLKLIASCERATLTEVLIELKAIFQNS